MTWWRKRPSVHVAEYDQEALWAAQNQRFDGLRDMSNVIFMLDADTSHFTTMMQKLSNPGYAEIVVKKLHPSFAVGSFIFHEQKLHRIESIKRKSSDDWFAPEEYVLGIRKPWVEKPVPKETLYRWLEDDFMPRLHSKPFNTKAILNNITDTYGA